MDRGGAIAALDDAAARVSDRAYNRLAQLGHAGRSPRRRFARRDEGERVDRGVALALGARQRPLQLLGARLAAAREHNPADHEGEREDDPRRGKGENADHQRKQQNRSDARARTARRHQPPAARDRVPKLVDAELEFLDVFGGSRRPFVHRAIMSRLTTPRSRPWRCAHIAALFHHASLVAHLPHVLGRGAGALSACIVPLAHFAPVRAGRPVDL